MEVKTGAYCTALLKQTFAIFLKEIKNPLKFQGMCSFFASKYLLTIRNIPRLIIERVDLGYPIHPRRFLVEEEFLFLLVK